MNEGAEQDKGKIRQGAFHARKWPYITFHKGEDAISKIQETIVVNSLRKSKLTS